MSSTQDMEDMKEYLYNARRRLRGVLSDVQKQIDVVGDLPEGLSVSVWIDAFRKRHGDWTVRANADLFDGKFEDSPNKKWIHDDALTFWFDPKSVASAVECLEEVLLTDHTLAYLGYCAAKRIGHTGTEVAA